MCLKADHLKRLAEFRESCFIRISEEILSQVAAIFDFSSSVATIHKTEVSREAKIRSLEESYADRTVLFPAKDF